MISRMLSLRKTNSMPRLIPDTDFNTKLRMPAKNIDHTKHFLAEGVEDFKLAGYITPCGYRLVKSLKKDQYRLVTNNSNPKTVYLVELIFRTDIVFGKTTCTQVKVWRTISHEHKAAIRDLPSIFFANLLQVHRIVVTDEEQTRDGKRFWESVIDWALSLGFFVYASDGTQMNRTPSLIIDMDNFYSQWDKFCWGHDPDVHSHRLVVISQTPLEQ